MEDNGYHHCLQKALVSVFTKQQKLNKKNSNFSFKPLEYRPSLIFSETQDVSKGNNLLLFPLSAIKHKIVAIVNVKKPEI